ncbi:MAG: type I secretion C-terminal target domain-containing protein [Phenylobacterium sp.]|nr:MAG: type I secretion C-terminal target domain-containing protein [Phenylobacterium sp.]
MIQLASGNYGEVAIGNMNFAGSGITITSANPAAEATITGLNMANSSGVTVSNLNLVYSSNVAAAAVVNGGSNITFNGVQVSGPVGTNTTQGIVIRNASNVTVTNSNIHDVGAGIAHQNDSYLTITNNQIHDITLDGVRGGGSSNVTISGNTFTDFHPEQYAHNDAIQFWTTGTTTATHDITVTNNTFERGPTGTAVQAIFMGNENAITYQNVTIENNAIEGEGYHGITVIQANSLAIENNLVEGYQDMTAWIEVENSSNSTVSNNAASSYILQNNTNLTQANDVTLKQAVVGDTSVLDYWVANHGAAPAADIVGNAPLSTTTATTAASVAATPAVVAAPSAVVSAGVTIDATGHVFTGTAGNDSVLGTAGSDTISGGTGGADTLAGGAGDDLYIVNNYGSNVIEQVNGGTDTVHTTLGLYQLTPNVENLVLDGTVGQRGYGNAGNNVITCNSVLNQIDGGAGNDTIVSMGGSQDVYVGGAGNDVFQFDVLPKSIATITDFTPGQDELDLAPLLTAYHGTNPVADGWVKFTTDSTGTTVYVDQDGHGTAHGFVAVAKLTGVTQGLTMGSDWIFH